MKTGATLGRALVTILCLLLAACGRKIDAKSRFTKDCAAAILASDPHLKVETVNDLELRVSAPGREPYSLLLANAYADAEADPTLKSSVIQKYVAAALERARVGNLPFDRNLVVPVIKDRAWLQDMAAFQKSRGAQEPVRFVYDDFNEELVVVYAMDTPSSVQFLTPKVFEGSGVARSELRAIAVANLRKLLTNIEIHSGPLVSTISAGGDYESSLLLLDEVWSVGKVEVDGDLLVAIPARGVLLFAGSKTPGAVERLSSMSEELSREGGHTLTPTLFVRQDGRFVRWKPN